MPYGIQGEAPRRLGGIVPQGVGREAVGQLVQRDAQQRRDHPQQNIPQAAEIKTVEYFL